MTKIINLWFPWKERQWYFLTEQIQPEIPLDSQIQREEVSSD